jgi:hypothetical protein
MGGELVGVAAVLVDEIFFYGIPIARLAVHLTLGAQDKKKEAGGPGSLDENSLEGRINRALSRADFAGAEELARQSELTSYEKSRVLNEIEGIKQKLLDYIKQQEERNAKIREYVRDGHYDQAIDFVRGLDVSKEDKKRIVAALKDDRRRRPQRQAFAEAARYGQYDEARSALVGVTQWSANKKAIYALILQELERIARKEMSDRDYGRAIAQVGQLDLTRSQRRERIQQLEIARGQLPEKEYLVEALNQGSFDNVRKIADSLHEWPDDFKAPFRVFIDDIESVSPSRW